jgi:hypothetical protein
VTTEERLVTPRAERKGEYPQGKENHYGRTNSDEDAWREDIASPNDGDVWATPKEEGFNSSGFFHHERGGYA